MRGETTKQLRRVHLDRPGGSYLPALLVGVSLLLAACHTSSSTNHATSTTTSGVGTPHRTLSIGTAPLRQPFLLFVLDCKGRSAAAKLYLNVSKTDPRDELFRALSCPPSATRISDRFWVKSASLINNRILLYLSNPKSNWQLSVSGVARAPDAPMIGHLPPPPPSHHFIPPIPVGLPKSAPSCSADNLVASVQDSVPTPPQGAFLSALITLRASGTTSCSLRGYPTVQLDGTGGVAEQLVPTKINPLFLPLVRPSSNHPERPQPDVIVKRGVQNAEVPISLPLLCGPEFTSTPLTPYIGVTVTLPDRGGSLTIPGRDFVDRATPVGYQFSSCGQGKVYQFEPSYLFSYLTNLGPPGS